MGNCSAGSYVDGNFRVPQPQDEIIIQTDLSEITKAQMKTFQIPFDTYVLIEFTNMAPVFLPSTIAYKKQKYDQISKSIKKVKGVYFQDECFNVKNMINSVISYIDENIQESKNISKYEVNALTGYKIGELTKVYINNNKNELSNERDVVKYFEKVIKEKESFIINRNTNNITINTFGNANLLNVILFILEKDNFWVQNLLYKFDYETKIFIIKLYIQGIQRHILLDESIAINDKKEPVFINPPIEQFWILLVEKAIAKVNRSYGNSLRCFASELFPLLSGIPLMKYSHSCYTQKEISKLIKEALSKKYVCFSECDNNSNEDKKVHPYPSLRFLSFFIESIFKVNNHKFIELTIPINNEATSISKLKVEMLKDYQDDIKNTTFFPKEKMESNQTIYMSYDFIYTYFQSTFIYKYEEQYIYSTKKLEISSNQYTMLKLNPLQKTKTIITVHLKESRYSSQDIPNCYTQVLLVRLKVDETIIKKKEANATLNIQRDYTVLSDSKGSFYDEENEYLFEYVNSAFSSDSKNSIEVTLDPNETYYILVKLICNVNLTMNCVVSLYSSTFIEIVENLNSGIENIIEHKFLQPQNLTTLIQSLKYFFISHTNIRENYEDKVIENQVKYSVSKKDITLGFKIIKVENYSDKKFVTMTLEYNSIDMNLITLTIAGKVNESQKEKNDSINEFKLILAPGSSEILIFQCLKIIPSYNFFPQFIIDRQQQFNIRDFQTQKKTKINQDVYYQEIPYGKGVFVIVINSSDIEYVVRAIFDVIDNLEVDTENDDNEVEMILKPLSKNFINLRMIDTKAKIAYQITFLSKINNVENEVHH